MAPFFTSQLLVKKAMQWKQLENARSIQIVSNNAEQGHCLSGIDWQVTADVWSPRRDGGTAGAEYRGRRIMQFALTRKPKICFSPILVIRPPCSLQTSSAKHSSYSGLQINLLMEDTLHALSKVVILFAFSSHKHMPSCTKGILIEDS